MAKAKGKSKTADKKTPKKGAAKTATPEINSDMVDVELLQAVKIGKFTYRAGRTVGLTKETADDLIKENKAKKV